MVPFAGFSMPVQYSDFSVSESHKWTREKSSLFDVGHMVQHKFSGAGAEKLLLQVTPASLDNLKPNHSTLSCLLKPQTGGIIDDTVITRLGPNSFYVVTNAACRDNDIAFIQSQIDEHGIRDLSWQRLDGWGLVALQGPCSAEVLEESLAKSTNASLKDLYFGQCVESNITLRSGQISDTVLISRGGYTGEDGFEISIPAGQAVAVTEALLATGGVDRLRWAGLGARDSLRLEAGMCLYGHDIDETTTPVEAGLSWVVGKDRREAGNFNGAEVILQQIKPKKAGGTGVTRRRIGLLVDGAPAREGATIIGNDGETIGNVTSGCPSPTLGKNIAMGYIKDGWQKAGTEVGVLVRGKKRKAVVTKMPFVPSRYWKQAAGTAPI